VEKDPKSIAQNLMPKSLCPEGYLEQVSVNFSGVVKERLEEKKIIISQAFFI